MNQLLVVLCVGTLVRASGFALLLVVFMCKWVSRGRQIRNCSPQCCLWQPAQPDCNPKQNQNTKHNKQNNLLEVVVYSNLSTTTIRIKQTIPLVVWEKVIEQVNIKPSLTMHIGWLIDA